MPPSAPDESDAGGVRPGDTRGPPPCRRRRPEPLAPGADPARARHALPVRLDGGDEPADAGAVAHASRPAALRPPVVHNFVDAWTQAPFGHWLLNTTIVSVTVVVSNLVFCSLAGYALARMRFFGSGALFLVILATLMVPFQVVMIPTLLIVHGLGLIDTLRRADRAQPGHPVRRLPAAAVLQDACRSRSRRRPASTAPAASGRWSRWCCRRCAPPLATLGIMTLLWTWNDFLWPLIAIQSEKNMTLPARALDLPGSAHDRLAAAHGRHAHEPAPDARDLPRRAALVRAVAGDVRDEGVA